MSDATVTNDRVNIQRVSHKIQNGNFVLPFSCFVDVGNVGGVVLVVVNFHCGCVDVGFQCFKRIVKIGYDVGFHSDVGVHSGTGSRVSSNKCDTFAENILTCIVRGGSGGGSRGGSSYGGGGQGWGPRRKDRVNEVCEDADNEDIKTRRKKRMKRKIITKKRRNIKIKYFYLCMSYINYRFSMSGMYRSSLKQNYLFFSNIHAIH